jgi:hypothetical protein
MRRAAASILVTLGLLAAGLAWWAYAARYTVLDSARSEKIAETLITQPVIQDAVADGLGTALEQALPPGTPISPDEVSAVAHRALADPRALAALKTTVLTSHQRLVGDYDGPVTLDVSPIAVAGRDALLAARPDLAGVFPQAPTLSIDLPTQHLPKLGWLPERTRELFGFALMLAITLLGLGLLTSSDRPKVLQRTGRWGVRAGFFWALFGWVIPFAMTKIGEPRLAALGAIGVATVGPMIAPAVLVTCIGIGALLGARAWRQALAALPAAPPAGGPSPLGQPWPSTSGTAAWDWDNEPLPTRTPRRGYARPEDEKVSSRTWRL